MNERLDMQGFNIGVVALVNVTNHLY